MRKLYDLDPHEVSLVPRGANKKKFLIYKMRKGNEMPQTETEKLINSIDPKVLGNIDKVLKTMVRKDGAPTPPKPNQHTPGQAQPLSDRAQAALKAVARIIAPFKEEISDEHLDAVQNEVGIQPGSNEGQEHSKVEMSMAIPEGVSEEHHSASLDMAQKAYMTNLEKMGYRKYPDQQPKVGTATVDKKVDEGDDDPEEEDVSKVNKILELSEFSEKQKSQLEKIFKSHDDLVNENKTLVQKTADLEKELKTERDIRVTKGFEEKAKAFKHLGSNTEELAVIMKSMAETDPKAYDKLEAVLKAADNQIRVAGENGKAGLFGEIGSSQGNRGGNSAEAKLDAAVDAIVAKSDGKTREQCYDDFLKTSEGKRLYAEFKSSRPNGI